MLEAIEGNRQRSLLLLFLMAALLVGLGYAVGSAWRPGAGLHGMAVACGVWFVLWLLAAFQGDEIFLSMAGAQAVRKEDHPQLWNVVEEMTIAAGLPKPPEIYVIPDDAPNAFAVGRRPEKGSVAVTSGLLRLMDRDELQGVVAHEIGHLKNRDSSFMVLAGLMVGAIVILADIAFRSMRFGGRGGRRRSTGGGGGQAQLIIFLVVIALAILAPILARLLYFACSRRREFLADASAARFTRYPEGLASALEKLSGRPVLPEGNNRVLAPMYIVNPLEASGAFSLFSTHPPVEKRVRVLRGMAGAGYASYEEAFRKVQGGRSVVGRRTLAADTPAAVRPPEDSKADAARRSRDVVDLLARLDGMVSMTCACGMGIRVPGGYREDGVRCPRCGAQNAVPAAAEQRFQRRGEGWQSFRCECGHPIHLSPAFVGAAIPCPACGRRIEIV